MLEKEKPFLQSQWMYRLGPGEASLPWHDTGSCPQSLERGLGKLQGRLPKRGSRQQPTRLNRVRRNQDKN
jgi:hypothetical protein